MIFVYGWSRRRGRGGGGGGLGIGIRVEAAWEGRGGQCYELIMKMEKVMQAVTCKRKRVCVCVCVTEKPIAL